MNVPSILVGWAKVPPDPGCPDFATDHITAVFIYGREDLVVPGLAYPPVLATTWCRHCAQVMPEALSGVSGGRDDFTVRAAQPHCGDGPKVRFIDDLDIPARHDDRVRREMRTPPGSDSVTDAGALEAPERED